MFQVKASSCGAAGCVPVVFPVILLSVSEKERPGIFGSVQLDFIEFHRDRDLELNWGPVPMWQKKALSGSLIAFSGGIIELKSIGTLNVGAADIFPLFLTNWSFFASNMPQDPSSAGANLLAF